jgi:hypothetical protein
MQHKNSLPCILILLLLPYLTAAQEPAWLVRLKQMPWLHKVSKLKPLKSNRAEVEVILGKPREYNFKTADFIQEYNPKEGMVSINFTTQVCTSTDGKIPKDTIQEISFYPEADIRFTDLKIPRKQFTYEKVHDTVGKIYTNHSNGIRISVAYNKVEGIHFYPAEGKEFNCVLIPALLSDLEKIKKIKLFETNRDEVRQLFKDYKLSWTNSNYQDVFEANSTEFEFSYSDGRCEYENSDGFDTPEWKVIGIKIKLRYFHELKDLGVNLAGFAKEKIYQNNPDYYIFHDKEKGIGYKIANGEIGEIDLFPSSKFYPLMCDQKKAKILTSTNSFFVEKLKDRIYSYEFASIKSLGFNRREIFLKCDSNQSTENKTCADDNRKVKVFAEAKNPREDPLTYNYTVSGGKIIGYGEKVVWDLSGVKPGTFQITAAVDDGCGFCGNTMTKKVVVKEFSKCR